MNAAEALTAARRYARRFGYGARSVKIAYDARRKFGCSLLKRTEPTRRAGRYVPALTLIAVPASWQEAESVEWRPVVDVVRTPDDVGHVRRSKRYYRLTKYCQHGLAHRIAFKTEDVATMALVAKFLRDGTLRLDLSGRFGAGCKPSEVDRELLKLMETVRI